MAITTYKDLEQGTPEWHQARCGIVTASNVSKIITEKKMELAKNKKSEDYMYELIAAQITGRAEITNIGFNGLRGHRDEERALELYERKYGEIERVGFITNDCLGFKLGFSPDALVGDDGFIECKGRLNKFQIKTVIDGKIPDDFVLQVLEGFIVTERKWCDFLSFSNGMNMLRIRYYPDVVKLNLLKQRLVEFHQYMAQERELYLQKSSQLYYEGDLIDVEYEEMSFNNNDENELTFSEDE